MTYGSVSINTASTEGLRVTIDGVAQSDPLQPMRVTAGEVHRLVVTGEHIDRVERAFSAQRGQTKPLEITLVFYGTVPLPWDSLRGLEVRIDDRPRPEEEGKDLRLPVGAHTLNVTGPKHKPLRTPLPVQRGPNPAPEIVVELRDEFRPPAPTLTNRLGMEFVFLPAGEFSMGSPLNELDRLPDEAPHKVAIDRPFYFGVHEVRVADFRSFVKETNHQTEAEKKKAGAWRLDNDTKKLIRDPRCTWLQPGWAQTDAHPVVCVSWNDARVFCEWLSQNENKTYRLPTEKEWEYACRAGTTTPFCCGSTLSPAVANFNGSATQSGVGKGPFLGCTAPVGSYAKNAFGLFDMHGNVWEWCLDAYRVNPTVDKEADTSVRILRGGSWYDPAKLCRSAYRSYDTPERCYPYVGFRVVCESAPAPSTVPATPK